MPVMRPTNFPSYTAKDRGSAKYPSLWDGLVLACVPQEPRRNGNVAPFWNVGSAPPSRAKTSFGDCWFFNGSSLSVIDHKTSYVGVDGQPRSVVLGVSRSVTHDGYVFDQGSDNVPYRGHYCYASGDKFYFGGGAVGFEINSGSTTIDIGYSFVYTHVGTTRTLYKNGEFLSTSTNASDTYLQPTKQIYMGKSHQTSPHYYFNGNIHYLYFYSRAISAQEIRMFASGFSPLTPRERFTVGMVPPPPTSRPWTYGRASTVARPCVVAA